MGRLVIIIGAAVVCIALVIGAFLLPRHVAVIPGISGCRTLHPSKHVETCIRQRSADVVATDGLSALAEQIDAAGKHAQIQLVCHVAMHEIGTQAGKRAAQHHDQPPFVEGPANCSQGIAHGVLIGFLDSATASTLTRFDPTSLCPHKTSTMPNDRSAIMAITNCVHAVGHAAYRTTRSLQAAAAICDRVVGKIPGQQSTDSLDANCYQGITMERAIAHPALADRCPSARSNAARIRNSCLIFLAQNMNLAGASLPDMVRACRREATSRAELDACAAGVGATAFKRDTCNAFTGTTRRVCQEGHDAMWSSASE